MESKAAGRLHMCGQTREKIQAWLRDRALASHFVGSPLELQGHLMQPDFCLDSSSLTLPKHRDCDRPFRSTSGSRAFKASMR